MSGSAPNTIDRRALLVGTGAAAAGVAALPLLRNLFAESRPAFLARNQRYDGSLVTTIRDGLLATGLDASLLPGRRVLLKPNMVEPTRDIPHMTTHPAMILAAAEVFRGWGAKVTVGEAPGHVRDTEMALVESGVQEALDLVDLEFADLNYEEVAWVPNGGRASRLDGFFFPRSAVEADLIVSMPKLKTHHWAGMTASMKNLYGVIPGIVYGWPKNVLHHAGIPETVFDINASLPPAVAIVDGIDCMEGDGPILGSLKHLGVVGIGTNLPALDATLARVMGFEPSRIPYMHLAADRLGPIDDRRIDQRGERWQELLTPFKVLDRDALRSMRAEGFEALVT